MSSQNVSFRHPNPISSPKVAPMQEETEGNFNICRSINKLFVFFCYPNTDGKRRDSNRNMLLEDIALHSLVPLSRMVIPTDIIKSSYSSDIVR